MSDISAKIEALLLLSARPVSFHKLAGILGVKEIEVKEAIKELAQNRNVSTSGIHVIVGEGAVELGTNPAFAEIISSMKKEETGSDLTRPQLETLTIIAYRGPVTKNEVEYIRGVNCSLIIRNLLMRGLIVEREEEGKFGSYYTVSTEMLRHLGIHTVAELPDYESLHKHAKINEMLEAVFQKEV